MRVLMQGRADLFDKPGGDLIQMQKTQQALQKLGVEVDISTSITPSLADYDLVHLYNISRIHETYAQLLNAKRQKCKVVVSPIHHKLSEINRYERLGRTGKLKILNYLLPNISLREQAKNLVRLRDSRQRKAILGVFVRGFMASQKYVLSHSDAWIVLAESEAEQIVKDFGVKNTYFVAANGIDSQFFNANKRSFVDKYKLDDFILCVSRVEDRKNQIALIQACKDMGKKLVFIGGENKNHADYSKRFKELVEQNSSWVYYLGALPYADLPSAYAAACLHVLPSWFEVVSLTALEAAASGCAEVVADTGFMREYLGDDVAYCDPADVSSIRLSIANGLSRDGAKLQSHLRHLTWAYTAQQTLKLYEEIL